LLTCCHNDFVARYSFEVDDKDCLEKRIEFGYCPHCEKAIYLEIKKDFHSKVTSKLLKNYEAERAFNKAMFNRLHFISKLEQGSRARQNWCFGDFKHGTQRDEKGRLIQFQIKRNLNGQEVENFGVAKVVYK
jgi:hypothetical protein